MSKPSIPQGTRDFSPAQVAKRTYIFDTIKETFKRYGFQAIETPTLENLSTLTGKYGDEGDKLLFKVLNNGDFLAKANKDALADMNSAKLISSIADRGLRYDLTVPFARYVVMHQNDITFPFKRYQIQPVWRADNPQRGRYREFYQCDADVVGSPSLMYEAELVQIYDSVFSQLGVRVVIKVNNRKILEGIAEVAGIQDKFMDMTIAIDKLDKIGIEGVEKELTTRGIGDAAITIIKEALVIKELAPLKTLLEGSEIGQKGIAELEAFHTYLDMQATTNPIEFDITLARGLNYYTGCIFEVVAQDVKMGSIGGGGRYDDLTGVFGLKNVSGVGISFGADRIYDVIEELDLFPKNAQDSLKLLFIALDTDAHKFAFGCINQVRNAGINADIYPEAAKIEKQLKFAKGRNAQYIAIIGDDAADPKAIKLRNTETREQQLVSIEALIDLLK